MALDQPRFDAKDTKARSLEVPIANRIALDRVHCTIDLDDEVMSERDEIEHVRTERMLTPEVGAERISAKTRPEDRFARCRVAPHVSGPSKSVRKERRGFGVGHALHSERTMTARGANDGDRARKRKGE